MNLLTSMPTKNDILYKHQQEAVEKLKNGSILVGDVGTGKSRTALAYFCYKEAKAALDSQGFIDIFRKPEDLYVITTPRKRDTKDWEEEALIFRLYRDSKDNPNGIKFEVDSWNNIAKYENVSGAFFIFDEQRVIGHGAWVKSFLKITKKNRWILLSATPGDNWMDYIPVFIANGFYRNRTQFVMEHVIFSRFAKYPKVERYIDIPKLNRLRDSICVTMPFMRQTVRHDQTITASYNSKRYDIVVKARKNPWKENEPIMNAGELCYCLRRCVNEDPSRLEIVKKLFKEHPRLIVFYNFNYELEMLRSLIDILKVPFAEWNGQKHEPIPKTRSWVYLVQYTAGSEGWNCTTTDTIVFFSQNYSYKVMAQAAGRIDRLNTKYTDLYFYHIESKSTIDRAIRQAIADKTKFNEELFENSIKN